MWRDPLDEPRRGSGTSRSFSAACLGLDGQFLRLQRLTDAILYGPADHVAALIADPAYQQWVSQSRAARTRSE